MAQDDLFESAHLLAAARTAQVFGNSAMQAIAQLIGRRQADAAPIQGRLLGDRLGAWGRSTTAHH